MRFVYICEYLQNKQHKEASLWNTCWLNRIKYKLKRKTPTNTKSISNHCCNWIVRIFGWFHTPNNQHIFSRVSHICATDCMPIESIWIDGKQMIASKYVCFFISFAFVYNIPMWRASAHDRKINHAYLMFVYVSYWIFDFTFPYFAHQIFQIINVKWFRMKTERTEW